MATRIDTRQVGAGDIDLTHPVNDEHQLVERLKFWGKPGLYGRNTRRMPNLLSMGNATPEIMLFPTEPSFQREGLRKRGLGSMQFVAASSQYGELAPPGNKIVSGRPLTFAAWVRPTSLTGNHPIMAIADANATNQYAVLYVDGGSDRFAMSSSSGSINNAVTANSSANTGVWYFVMGTMNRAGHTRIWLNGDFVNLDNTNNVNPTGIDNFTIGALRTSSPTYGSVVIDDFMLWDYELDDESDGWELYEQAIKGWDQMLRRTTRRTTVALTAAGNAPIGNTIMFRRTGNTAGKSTIDITQPVNEQHPVCEGVMVWYKAGIYGRNPVRWPDLMNNFPLTFQNTPDWWAFSQNLPASGGPVEGSKRTTEAGLTFSSGASEAAIYDNFLPGRYFSSETFLPCTLSCWVKLDNAGVDHWLVNIYDQASNNDYIVLRYNGASAQFEATINDGTNSNTAIASGLTEVADRWYHVIASFNASGHAVITVNGRQYGTDSTNTVNPNSLDELGVGGIVNTSAAYSSATLDDVVIWNRELTTNEKHFVYTEAAMDFPEMLRHTTRRESFPIADDGAPPATVVGRGLTFTTKIHRRSLVG